MCARSRRHRPWGAEMAENGPKNRSRPLRLLRSPRLQRQSCSSRRVKDRRRTRNAVTRQLEELLLLQVPPRQSWVPASTLRPSSCRAHHRAPPPLLRSQPLLRSRGSLQHHRCVRQHQQVTMCILRACHFSPLLRLSRLRRSSRRPSRPHPLLHRRSSLLRSTKAERHRRAALLLPLVVDCRMLFLAPKSVRLPRPARRQPVFQSGRLRASSATRSSASWRRHKRVACWRSKRVQRRCRTQKPAVHPLPQGPDACSMPNSPSSASSSTRAV